MVARHSAQLFEIPFRADSNRNPSCRPAARGSFNQEGKDFPAYMNLQRSGNSVNEPPWWPLVFSFLGPAVLISAMLRKDGFGVYAAGGVVTLVGWSQLIWWFMKVK
jgi:hypothetical protein